MFLVNTLGGSIMKKCPKCSIEHEKAGIFCSRKCANSRTFSDETKLKKSVANKKFHKSDRSDHWYASMLKNAELVKQRNVENKEQRTKELYEKRISKGYDNLKYDPLREVVIYEQNNKCMCCGIDSWQGEKIILELDHIDGVRDNNDRKNLRALCPNCHSQTPTWKGKHYKKKLGLLDIDFYKAYIDCDGNLIKAMKKLGIRWSKTSRKRILDAVKKYKEP
jgi:hypothetical protein